MYYHIFGNTIYKLWKNYKKNICTIRFIIVHVLIDCRSDKYHLYGIVVSILQTLHVLHLQNFQCDESTLFFFFMWALLKKKCNWQVYSYCYVLLKKRWTRNWPITTIASVSYQQAKDDVDCIPYTNSRIDPQKISTRAIKHHMIVIESRVVIKPRINLIFRYCDWVFERTSPS